MSIIDLLKLPEAKTVRDLDSPDTARIHKQIIQNKPFLKNLYFDFYNEFKKIIETIPSGQLVEIGSGSGFLKEVIPNVITTDLFPSSNIDVVLKGTKMPFKDSSVSAFFLQDVLHHIKEPITFFTEITRCLVNKGKIIMIEPHMGLWGKFIWSNFHHEPLDATAGWEIKQEGRLTGANQALPWIIFFRDRKKFEQLFPDLKIKRLAPHTPFRYIISGGLSIKQLLPSFTYNSVKFIERLCSPLSKHLGMFITIELHKETTSQAELPY